MIGLIIMVSIKPEMNLKYICFVFYIYKKIHQKMIFTTDTLNRYNNVHHYRLRKKFLTLTLMLMIIIRFTTIKLLITYL